MLSSKHSDFLTKSDHIHVVKGRLKYSLCNSAEHEISCGEHPLKLFTTSTAKKKKAMKIIKGYRDLDNAFFPNWLAGDTRNTYQTSTQILNDTLCNS